MAVRKEQRNKTREKILAVSLQLFTHKGYGSTTIRNIAQEAHISVGLLFHYFPTKQALLEAHLDTAKEGVESFIQLLETAKQPLETFETIAQIVLESFKDAELKNLFLLVNQATSFGLLPVKAADTFSVTGIIGTSERLITLGQQKGEIKEGDPRALAVAFWGAIQGIAELLAWHSTAPIPHSSYITDILRK